MFFIFASPRSGTTLLAQCLSAHSQIVVPHETDFIIPLAFVFHRIRDADAGREILVQLITRSWTFSWSLGEYVSADRVRDLVHSCDYRPDAVLEAVFAEVARAAGAKLAGDKSPADLQYVQKLVNVNGISPEMKIIHLVRDVRDVMASLSTTGWSIDGDPFYPRFWGLSNIYLYELYRANPTQYYFLRYEDWMHDPEKFLREICRFLGFPFEGQMLDPRCRHRRYKEIAHHANLTKPISTDSIGRYLRDLTPDLIQSYERQAREALEMFGYGLSTPSDGRQVYSWRLRASWFRRKPAAGVGHVEKTPPALK
jgi:hypothetical protein